MSLLIENNNELILVVDDLEVNRELISRRIEKQGYEVVTANNGIEALEQLNARSFDLVLLDIMMPEMDGFQVLEAMKKHMDFRHIPVIVITALAESEGVIQCIEMGAVDYISKPFNPTFLKARISASLEKKRLHDREKYHLMRLEEIDQQLLFANKDLRIALEEAKFRKQEISHINQVVQAVNSSLNLEQVLPSVMEALQSIFRFDQICTALIDETSQEIYFQDFHGSTFSQDKKDRLARLRISMEIENNFLVETVLQNEPICIPTITGEQVDTFEAGDQAIYRINPLKGILYFPMLAQQKVIGVICFGNSFDFFDFCDEDIEKLEHYVSQVAVSIHNAIVYEDLKNTRIQLNETEKIAALTSTFEKFVPRKFLNRFAKGGVESLELGMAEGSFITILFSDIRGFTHLSESMPPQEVFHFLNSYIKCVSAPIHAQNGFIDKFMGDGIMALFDRPQGTDFQEAEDSVRAGIGMQMALIDYNREREQAGVPPIFSGIGIHSGNVIIGTMGVEERMDLTVLGDAVNLSSRLEGATKRYNASILISGTTFKLLKNPDHFLIRCIDRIRVKGKSDAVTIYEVFDADLSDQRELKQRTKATFEQGCQCFAQQAFGEAEALFQECLRLNSEDIPAKIHLERCRQFATVSLDENWDGVTVLTDK